MSVNRYAPAAEYRTETGEYIGSMDELPDGQYVALADYDALARELAEATELLSEVDHRVIIMPSLGKRIADYLDRCKGG